MNRNSPFAREEIRTAQKLWGSLSRLMMRALTELIDSNGFSITAGDLIYVNNHWYVTHTGLLRLARRHRCAGIHVRPVRAFCNLQASKWTFFATVYKSPGCKGFVGYGDADPGNVSPLVRGAEMRMAETRAVNRALRKAYGIGTCSVEEIGSLAQSRHASRHEKKISPPPTNGTGRLQPRLRDRLCQLIRQHQLDPVLVKSYALDFCKIKTLKEASRDQIDNFITHLSDCAVKDKHALLCQLNSYTGLGEGAA
jgi:hypothetical protein